MFEGMSPFSAFLFSLMVVGFATVTSLIAWIAAVIAAFVAQRLGSVFIPLLVGLLIVILAVSSSEGLGWSPHFLPFVAVPIAAVFGLQFTAAKLAVSKFISRNQMEWPASKS
jgi:hypothetical protein